MALARTSVRRRVKLVESAKNCSMLPFSGPVVRKVKKRTGLQVAGVCGVCVSVCGGVGGQHSGVMQRLKTGPSERWRAARLQAARLRSGAGGAAGAWHGRGAAAEAHQVPCSAGSTTHW